MAKRDRIPWDPAASADTNARARLPALAAAYLAAGRAAAAKPLLPAALHQFRLATKQFRYTLELFRPCYGPGLEQRLKRLQHLQQLLGEINDYATTQELLDSLPHKSGAEHQKVGRFLKRSTSRKIEEFRRYWQNTFNPGEQDRWWTAYLAGTRNRTSH